MQSSCHLQMVLSFQWGLQSTHQRILELEGRRKCQRKPKEEFIYLVGMQKKERILQKIQILSHAVSAFPRETSRYQSLPLLHRSGFQRRNQKANEVQEHKVPSACLRTTVSLRPRTQIRKRKRYLWLSHHIPGRSYCKLNKVLTTEKILSLRITSPIGGVERYTRGKLKIDLFK